MIIKVSIKPSGHIFDIYLYARNQKEKARKIATIKEELGCKIIKIKKIK